MAFWTCFTGTGAVPLAHARAVSILIDGAARPATLIEIDGTGAALATSARPAPGRAVTLRHAAAGAIPATVAASGIDGLRLRFERGERAMGFALAIAAADASVRRRRDAA